jgi:hypothetical protein
MTILNSQEYLKDKGYLIPDYRYKNLNENF